MNVAFPRHFHLYVCFKKSELSAHVYARGRKQCLLLMKSLKKKKKKKKKKTN